MLTVRIVFESSPSNNQIMWKFLKTTWILWTNENTRIVFQEYNVFVEYITANKLRSFPFQNRKFSLNKNFPLNFLIEEKVRDHYRITPN